MYEVEIIDSNGLESIELPNVENAAHLIAAMSIKSNRYEQIKKILRKLKLGYSTQFTCKNDMYVTVTKILNND